MRTVRPAPSPLTALAPLLTLATLVGGAALAADPAAPAAPKRPVEAGPLWNQADANNKCPAVCAPPARWTGQWWTTVQGRMSVCECELPPPPPPPAAMVTIYEHGGYQGRSAALGVGRYDIHQMRLPNDLLSSVRVPAGLQVTLYEHGGFGGRTKVLTADVAALGKDFNDLTSSIVIAEVGAGQNPPPVQPAQLPPPPPQTPPPAVAAPPVAAGQAMSDQLFAKLIKHMQDASFPKEQLATLGDELAVGSKLNTAQVIRVMEVLTFPDYQVKGVLMMWPSVVDPQNLPDVLAAFTFPSHRDQVRKALKK